MAYTADYVFADLATITGDVIGKAGIEAGDFTSLFVLLAVVGLGAASVAWIRNR